MTARGTHQGGVHLVRTNGTVFGDFSARRAPSGWEDRRAPGCPRCFSPTCTPLQAGRREQRIEVVAQLLEPMEHATYFAESWASADDGAGESVGRLLSRHCRAGSSHAKPDSRHHATMNRNSINGAGPARLDLARTGHAAWRWLTAAVLVHLVVSIVHGTTHSGRRFRCHVRRISSCSA
jgi:hypothetical protein